MDLLDRLLGHDAWTTATLIERCRPLAATQLDQEFDIGHRSVRATLNHIIFNMETWADLMDGRTEWPKGSGDSASSLDSLSARLEAAAAHLQAVARRVADRGGWDDRWLDILDDPPCEKTYGGAIAHVLTHSMHHRAQLLYMLRQLGLRDLPEGDVLTWENHATIRRHSLEP